MPPIYDDIRRAIKASDKTCYRLWQETGISQSRLSQLMGDTKGMSVEGLERLADALDLEITVRPKRRRKGR